MNEQFTVEDLRAAFGAMERFVSDGKVRLETLVKEASATADLEKIREFIRKPWCVLPKGAFEYWLVVPAWSEVRAGWLQRSTDTYRVFVVDRYSQWFGSIPEELRSEIDLPQGPAATVQDGVLRTDAKTATKLRTHLGATLEADKAWRVKPASEFELLADLIEMGAMPFAPRPVRGEDLRAASRLGGPLASLRDYQREAWEEFLGTGAVGVFWPTGAGKTVIGAYACARIVGRKLIVVPSRTLVDQWEQRLHVWCGPEVRGEVDVLTYQAYKRAKGPYKVLIVDECHRLPANRFSRFATIEAEYRLGLSASPFREDGRSNYIIALTGRPLGVDWERFIREKIVQAPNVRVRVFATAKKKRDACLHEARASKGRTLVFCDSLALGKSLARQLGGVPFIHGTTKNRLDVLADAPLAVISRVGDEGVSLPDLAKVIEVDFHGGSRRQELQRVGRLMHAKEQGEHVLLMTVQEHAQHGRRLLALEEKGLFVKVSDET